MEEVFETVGPWHVKIFILALLGNVPYGMFVMSLSFMAPKLEYHCKSWPGVSASAKAIPGIEGRCLAEDGNLTLKCTAWEYDHSIHQRTLVEEVSCLENSSTAVIFLIVP